LPRFRIASFIAPRLAVERGSLLGDEGTKFTAEIPSMSSNFRADHVGSLLRPVELLEARRSLAPAEKLHAIEDQHIARALQKQKDLGFGVFTDGELRRTNFMSDFTDAVEGFDFGDAVPRH
jgi:hypothetical protein